MLTKQSNRIWELDAWRGFAIIQMIIFHFMWDLNFFHIYPVNILGTGWQTFARLIATQFTLILGMSITISHYRASQKTASPNLFPKYLKRAGHVFGLGLLITIATYFFIGSNGFVIFGILHLLGVSVLVCYPFLGRDKWFILGIGFSMIIGGIYLQTLSSNSPWFIWLGIKQVGRAMVDYYPILPWCGVALVGMFLGYLLYPQAERRFSLPNLSDTLPMQGLQLLGQHSLLIYIIHQPILIGLLFLFGLAELPG